MLNYSYIIYARPSEECCLTLIEAGRTQFEGV